MYRQIANFQLRTNEGVLNGGYNNTCTWNVDMSKVLGEMYDKYEYFNLTLKCIAWDVLPAGVSSSGTTRLSTYYMTGLNWVNCNYDTLTNQLRDRSCIGTAYFHDYLNATNSLIYNNPENVVNTFCKSSTSVTDLTIAVYNIFNNSLAQMGAAGSRSLPLCIYDFCVTPCKDDSERFALLTLYEGVTSNSGATQTFNNINFKLLLGELWDKYDTYWVDLVDLQASPFTGGFAVNANSVVATVELTGLTPVVNRNDKVVILGTVAFDIARSYIIFNSSNNFSGRVIETENKTVVKINEMNDIVINFDSIVTNNIITVTSGNMGKPVFQLLFRPVK